MNKEKEKNKNKEIRPIVRRIRHFDNSKCRVSQEVINAHIDMNRYINVDKALIFVELSKDVGKSYGIAYCMLSNYLKGKGKSIFMRRYPEELDEQVLKFYDRIESDHRFQNLEIRLISHGITYTLEVKKDKSDTWEEFATCVCLRDYRALKSSGGYVGYNYCFYDEFIIPAHDPKHFKYFTSNEPKRFFELMDSFMRDNKDNYKVILTGNPLSLSNPYYDYCKIKRIEGAKQYTNGDMIAFFKLDNQDKWIKKQATTRRGKLFLSLESGDYIIKGINEEESKEFIMKINDAKLTYNCNLVYNDFYFKIANDGFRVYITDEHINKEIYTIYLQTSDNGLNRFLIDNKNKNPIIVMIKKAYQNNYLYFNNATTKSRFREVIDYIL